MKSPCENSPKSKECAAEADHSRRVLTQFAPYPTTGRSYATPSKLDGLFGDGPTVRGDRYCINSCVLVFEPAPVPGDAGLAG